MKPTLKDVLDYADMNGIPTEVAEKFFYHFAAVEWVTNPGHPITRWQYKLIEWWRSSDKFNRKKKLPVIIGKVCGVRGCNLPAVYKSKGEYDNYYCSEHMPDKVKEKYE